MDEFRGLTGPAVALLRQRSQSEPDRLQALQQQVLAQQNLACGAAGGAAAALIGAGIWAWITVLARYQIGWMAVGVGLLVGYSVRTFGKGRTESFGVVGAALALLGCLLGNLLSDCGFIALHKALPILQVFANVFQHPDLAASLLIKTFKPVDLLFYGLAVFEGYRFAFRRLTAKELTAIAKSEDVAG